MVEITSIAYCLVLFFQHSLSAITTIFETPEVANVIFSNLEPKENVHSVMLVCKIWQTNAVYPVQKQLVSKAEEELQVKMAGFLSMTNKKVRDYCSTFQETEQNFSDLTVKQTFEKFNGLTEKHCVSLHAGVSVSSNTYMEQLTWARGEYNSTQSPFLKIAMANLVNSYIDRKDDIPGKVFVCFKKDDREWVCDSLKKKFFPLELFDFTNGIAIQNGVQELLWKEGNYCFALNGKLIEVIIGPGTNPNYIRPLPKQNISPTSFYVPDLDAAKPS